MGKLERFSNRCMRAWRQDLFSQAIEGLSLLLKRYPRSWAHWCMLGICLREIGRHDQSLRALRKARRYAPPHFLHQASNALADTYKALGRFRTAERWYRKATQEAPHMMQRWISLGAFYLGTGRLKLAESALRRGMRIKGDPDLLSEVLLNLGYVLRGQGRYRKARDCFREAVRLDPRYSLAKRALRDVEPLADR